MLQRLLLMVLMLAMAEVGFSNFNQATALYRGRRYAEAANAYFNVYMAPQNRAERARAEWGLAQSLEALNLYYSASKYYSIIVRRGRIGTNPYFKSAMERLGKINSRVSLGQSHVVQLFAAKISSSDVPGPARGFYFYYKGIEAFSDKKLEKAGEYFRKVPEASSYGTGALFHLGVIANLSGSQSKAISYFEDVISKTKNNESRAEMYEASLMNIARVHYEAKRFPEAISYYGRVPRHSSHWLDAIWETSWAFFFMEKFNNTLGQIHTIQSPFFIDRFYPESYILQAITHLRMCKYDDVKKSMRLFKERYTPVFTEIKSMLNKYQGNPRGFYRLVYDYNRGSRGKYKKAAEILDKLAKVDAFREAKDTVHFSSRELEALAPYKGRWQSSGLLSTVRAFVNSKKSLAVSDAGRRMYRLSTTYYSQLLELSNETRMIVAEMQLGKLAKLRSKISAYKGQSKVEFIGGMQKLRLNQSLEFWPFEQEYWEDELGYYVYNLASKCAKPKK